MVEDSMLNVCRQDTTNSQSAIHNARVIPLGLTKPSLRPSVLEDISYSSKKQSLTPTTKLQKTSSTKNGSSVMHAKRSIYALKAGETQY